MSSDRKFGGFTSETRVFDNPYTGPWVDADRLWFQVHRGVDWYVREPFDQELSSLVAIGPMLDEQDELLRIAETQVLEHGP